MAGVSDGWRAALVEALKRRASVEEIQAALQLLSDQDGDLYLTSAFPSIGYAQLVRGVNEAGTR